MSSSGIGIKVADGSFFPVIEEGFTGKKRLILTTVEDNQTRLQIDLHTSMGGGIEGGAEADVYIGSLALENIESAPKGDPEIEVVLSVDTDENLRAIATDLATGDVQNLSVDLHTVTGGDDFEIPESAFDVEESGAGFEETEHESLLTGETYPFGQDDRRKEHIHKRKKNPLLLFGFILLGLVLIVVIAFLIYNAFKGPEIPPLIAGLTEGGLFFSKNKEPEADVVGSDTAATGAPVSESVGEPVGELNEEVLQSIGNQEVIESVLAQEVSEESVESKGVWYNIKKGDTLWDISATFYRNPWLYYTIVKTNQIKDPDRILAGTKIFIPDY